MTITAAIPLFAIALLWAVFIPLADLFAAGVGMNKQPESEP